MTHSHSTNIRPTKKPKHDALIGTETKGLLVDLGFVQDYNDAFLLSWVAQPKMVRNDLRDMSLPIHPTAAINIFPLLYQYQQSWWMQDAYIVDTVDVSKELLGRRIKSWSIEIAYPKFATRGSR